MNPHLKGIAFVVLGAFVAHLSDWIDLIPPKWRHVIAPTLTAILGGLFLYMEPPKTPPAPAPPVQ